ncbi:hypothetical protein SAY86_002205 [Trapa natans]|uniref:Uncharacterized protein n=1 Tax=Trapa natans TaxID=22666 RepID=A0AAN7LFM6_TRANT|nr:hypothetical protein SAY86_002205 [Trapa natans]
MTPRNFVIADIMPPYAPAPVVINSYSNLISIIERKIVPYSPKTKSIRRPIYYRALKGLRAHSKEIEKRARLMLRLLSEGVKMNVGSVRIRHREIRLQWKIIVRSSSGTLVEAKRDSTHELISILMYMPKAQQKEGESPFVDSNRLKDKKLEGLNLPVTKIEAVRQIDLSLLEYKESSQGPINKHISFPSKRQDEYDPNDYKLLARAGYDENSQLMTKAVDFSVSSNS